MTFTIDLVDLLCIIALALTLGFIIGGICEALFPTLSTNDQD